MTIKIGLVGLGKIVQDQHLPAIKADARYALIAGAAPHTVLPDMPCYPDQAAMLAAHPEIDAVALCTPPQPRPALAKEALAAGKHLLLEKPPGASLGEAEWIAQLGQEAGRVVFATWHARYTPAIEQARTWIAGRNLVRATITWKEDVRRWHPGQDWVWNAGSFGVFDPGVNALSILTRVLSDKVLMQSAVLDFPSNRDTPIAATLAMTTTAGGAIAAAFDWLQPDPPVWDMRFETSDGVATLSGSGVRLEIDGAVVCETGDREYPLIYARFAELIAAGQSEMDLEPLRLTSDAFMMGSRRTVAAFED